jgi:cell wall-associated NlpC family hydrolase
MKWKKKSMRKIIAIMLFSLLVPPAIGNATSHKPTLAQIEAAKKAEAAKKKAAADALKRLEKARGNLRALTVIAKAAEAKYQSARAELARATAKSVAATKVYEEAQASVAFTHREIGKLAVHAYRTGGGLTDIEMLLDSRGPQELIDRISTLDNLGSANKTALYRFKDAEEKAQKAKVIADAAKEEQRLVTIRVAEAKQEADDARTEQQKEVDKLQAVQDKLQRDLASAKKVRITLEQRRQLAILEETRASEATKVTGQAKIWRTGGPTGAKSSRTTQAQRLKAVEFAKRQVLAKKPYVWGDEGPNTFDCSGLVYAAYKYAGLGWPIWDRLNSGLYYTYTKQIPLADMQPGDLLFYSYKGTQSTIHHMSIYAGNGMMWEARSTKSGLRFSDIYSVDGLMPYAGRV